MHHAVIMAGGSGTRFWPASRRSRPKQFLSLASDLPLIRQTFDRVAPLVGVERVWVVTTADTAGLTREALPEIPAANVLAEPMGRDTAACAGYACRKLLAVDAEAVCVVLPADHVIGEEERFRDSLQRACDHVGAEGGLLTFGIRPTAPETGFGYLEVGAEYCRCGEWPVHRLARFVEKPDIDTARTYLEGGRHLWNSGIFAWRARDFLTELERQLPQLAAGLDRIAAAIGRPDEFDVVAEVYPDLQRISLDFGVMEGASSCWSMPVDYPWSDVGSWPALREVFDADGDGNVARGRTIQIAARNNVVVSDGPVVSVVGLEGVIVVATADGVLVADEKSSQAVKDVVAAIRDNGWDEVL